jgi:hypothetical protein
LSNLGSKGADLKPSMQLEAGSGKVRLDPLFDVVRWRFGVGMFRIWLRDRDCG